MRRRTLLATAALAAGSTGCLFGSRRFPRLGSIRVHNYHPEPTTVIVEVLDDDDLVLETTVDVPAGNDDDSATAAVSTRSIDAPGEWVVVASTPGDPARDREPLLHNTEACSGADVRIEDENRLDVTARSDDPQCSDGQ
jgi:hypothetical protein